MTSRLPVGKRLFCCPRKRGYRFSNPLQVSFTGGLAGLERGPGPSSQYANLHSPPTMIVTSEVLPSIRRTGHYECPVVATQTIDAAQQLAVRNAVARRAKNVAVHYQTVYHALYDRFQIPRYTELLRSDFDEAIRFIETCEIRPQIETAPRIPEGAVVLTREEAQTFLNVAYVVKYLFRPQYKIFAQLLNAVRSPMTGAFWDAFNDLSISIMADSLARHGLRIEDMNCYKALITGH